MIESLCKLGIGGGNEKTLHDYLDKCQPPDDTAPTVTKTQLEEQVTMIKIDKCNDEKIKLLLVAPRWDLRADVITAAR
eukprot:7850502-Pyramimonas_sp.AAC.1